MEETKQHGWKEFFTLIFKSKLPWHLYIIGTLVAAASTTVALIMPKYIQGIFEGDIFNNEVVRNYILLGVLANILVALSALFFSITPPIAMRNVQKTVWSKIMNMKMKDYSKQPSQQLISRITDDPVYIDSVVAGMKTVLTSTYSLVGSYGIMYTMNAKLTFALLPVIPYILIVSAIVGHYTQKTQMGVQTQYSGVTAFFAERLPRIRLVKSFNKEDEEIRLGKEILIGQYKAEKKRITVDLFAEPLMQSVRAIIVGTVLLYGSYLVTKGELKVSQVISFYLYAQFIHMNVLQYGLFWQTTKQAKGASEKISSILNSESERMKREELMPATDKQDLKFENVSFSYGERNILSHLNMTIPAGKVTAIVGPSGCGKSTIFKLIERLYDPNVGRLVIGNSSAEKIHLDDWRRSIATVSQSSPLISGSIRDNIAYGLEREVSDEEVRRAAELADALEFIEEFPEGFDTEVGEFGSRLSGGQRQRIAIARAFILDAPILLLDEATSSLDAQSESEIEKSLALLMKGRTTIIIAHDMNFVKNADKIIVIDAGTVSGSGTHDELIRSNKLYKILAAIQLSKDEKMIFT
ncbi:ABC transporter ATP-binding protein [Sporosarcina sp. ANT_H38]|uniref:ABC transporter ATP-binding protein n=1 Tax=Sporosarcina sp. ANT_H38 TaxID=2597358 RepID=UPI0011F0E9E4|nr:ABC transporter ATP-binding protein [Sporosarcina sp. ANT_H38]KAA0955596.1 ABC transporter ATP-binding protein [Sporosarcina sp. ANT_H38]